MGSSTSKAAKTASKLSASNTARKYPTRPPPSSNRTNATPPRPNAQEQLGPTVYPEPRIAEGRSRQINQDSQDPDLGLQARLQSLGPVQPNPTLSNTSTFNLTSRPALQHARDKKPASSSSSQTHTPLPTSSHDPSLTHSNFQPSASNPAQSIFPTRGPAQGRQNPAVSLLTARHRLAEDAEHEFSQVGKAGAAGRQFLDVVTLRQVLQLRDERGLDAEKIEEQFGLRKGVIARLGRKGVVGVGS